MAIHESEALITVTGNNKVYFQSKGYEIPTRRNAWGKTTTPRGTKINVLVKDLMPSSTVKLTKVCDVCGEHTKNQTYVSILANRGEDELDRCKKCGMQLVAELNKKYTTETFKGKVFEVVEDEYTVLGEYITGNTPIGLKHSLCGNEWGSTTPYGFIEEGIRCPQCYYKSVGDRNRSNTDDFRNYVDELTDGEYTILSEYIDSATPLSMRHNSCGNIYPVKPNKFQNGRRCPKCSLESRAESQRGSSSQFIEDVYSLVGDEYTVLGEYGNCDTGILMKHNKCKYEWDTTSPYSFSKGTRCPRCRESKGEKAVSEWLDKMSIDYERQHKFDDCRNILPLPFDFKVSYGDEMILIEYDGELHYKSVEKFGGDEYLRLVQHRDQIKNDYCKKEEIKLIRIPYWDYDNIEQILERELGLVTA